MEPGERIRAIRELRHLPLKRAAVELGVAESTLSRVENGRQWLTYVMAVRIARVLRCELVDFDEALSGPMRMVQARLLGLELKAV